MRPTGLDSCVPMPSTLRQTYLRLSGSSWAHDLELEKRQVTTCAQHVSLEGGADEVNCQTLSEVCELNSFGR